MLKRSLSLAASAAALLSFQPLFAQTVNCQLLGHLDPYTSYNDVWGYVAPNGEEFALLGATTGCVVVNCTNPAAPVQTGYFPWATSTWRDMRTYGHYAYVSSESGAGFQIIDLSNPNAPTLVGVIGAANSTNAHNVCVDVGTGKLYLIGCNTGTPVYDLAASPTNPPFLGFALGSGNANYFHDLCVQNGYAYGSMIYNGQLRIVNVNAGLDFNLGTLSNTTTPSTFTHNAWPNASATLVATTDERTGGVVKLYDITNKSAPIARGQFTPNSGAIPHNAFIVGNLCHVSFYTEGYQCYDISNPNNPVQVAAYDTWPGATGGYNGCWGVYPFQPSGNIYVSDISNGLYIVRPQITDLQVAHTPLANTTNESEPYQVVADITGTNPVTSASVTYRVGGGTWQTIALTSLVGTTWYANIPGQNAVTNVEYHLDAADSGGSRRSPSTGEYSFLVGSVATLWRDDFETETGWTHGTLLGADDWHLGVTYGRSGTSGGVGWSDPGLAYSGTGVRGNDLGGTGFNGSYPNSVNNWLQSPAIPTNNASGLTLQFRRYLSLAAGDTARILVNGTVLWSTTAATQDTSWTLVSYPIVAAATTTVRFELTSNSTNVAGGWTMDDMEIVRYSDAAPPLLYGAGAVGTGGIQPAISMSAAAALGTTPNLQGSSMLSNAPAILAINLADAQLNLNGLPVLVQPAGAASLFQVTSGAGLANWPFAVPTSTAFDNIYLYSQAFVLDAGAANGTASATVGLRFRICLTN